MIYKCKNPAKWHPTMHTRQKHHHPPIAWRTKLLPASWWRVIELCGLCHDEYHTLLNLYVSYNGVPPASERNTYSMYIRALVREVWEHRPQGKLPYTLSNSITEHSTRY